MTRIAIAYHSGYGHTEVLAHSVAQGVRDSGAEAVLLKIDSAAQDFDPLIDEITASDAVIFGAPTYMGDVSGVFKVFADATASVFFTGAWKDKLAAGFTNSASQSGDKFNTLVQLATYAAQHGMIWVSLGLLPGNNNSKGSPDDLNRLGGFLGALAQSNADEGPDKGPSKSDLATARHLGQRVAEQAKLRAPLKQAA